MINEKCPICNKGKIVIDDIIDIQDLNLETKKAKVPFSLFNDDLKYSAELPLLFQKLLLLVL